MVVRVKTVQGSFEVKLQNPGEVTPIGQQDTYTVHCVVADEGIWYLPNGHYVEVRTSQISSADRKGSWVGTQQDPSITDNPVVLGQVCTMNCHCPILTFLLNTGDY